MPIGAFLMMLVVGSIYPLMVLSQWPKVRAIKARLGQKITVSPRGFVWENGSQRIESDWDEILAWRQKPIPGWVEVPGLNQIETANGNFDFVYQGLKKGRDLHEILMQYAAHAIQKAPDGDALGAIQQKIDIYGHEKSVFNYRMRIVRAVIWCGWIYSGMIPLILFLRFSGLGLGSPPTLSDWWSISPMVLICGLPTLYLWLVYRFARVEVSAEGLRHLSLWGRRFVAWPEVSEFYQSSGWIVVVGKKRTLRFFLVAHAGELKKVIAERAINSRNKDWQAR